MLKRNSMKKSTKSQKEMNIGRKEKDKGTGDSIDGTTNLNTGNSDLKSSMTLSLTSSKMSKESIQENATNLQKLIKEKIKPFKDDRFVYLKYAVPKSSEYFTPYNLISAEYSELDKSEFFTISRHGVTYWSNTENMFTKLDIWLEEYDNYCSMMKIKTYLNFRMWKGFKVWQKTIQWRKYDEAKKFLQNNLFIATPSLGKTILDMRKEYCKFLDRSFVDVTSIENFHLFYFIDAQMVTYEKLKDSLMIFRKNVAKELYDACYEAIIAKGFSAEDEALQCTSTKKLKQLMSFTERANKRRYCTVLSKFLGYCDFMMISLLHTILKTTFEKLSFLFKVYHSMGPDYDELRNFDGNIGHETSVSGELPKNPFIKAELILKPDKVEVDPSREVTYSIFKQLVDWILEAIRDVERFQSDEVFKQFTEPSIMGRQEDRLCGNPPDLEFILSDDIELNENKKIIFTLINEAYDKVDIFMERFEPIRLNYDLDLKTNPKELTDEKEFEKLKAYCDRYIHNMSLLDGIKSECNLGLLQLKQGTFKEEVTPVCRELLQVLAAHLPKLAIDTVATVIEKGQEVIMRLKSNPDETLQIVTYLRYIDLCSDIFDKLDIDLKYAYDVFIMMKQYSFFVDDTEKDKYLDAEDLLTDGRNILSQKIDDKNEIIQRLEIALQSDIKKVFEEVEEVSKETTEDWLLTETSDSNLVKETLQNLLERLQICESKSQDYRKYQRNFKIDVTRFDSLIVALTEVKQRQLLWNSVSEWNKCIEDWYALPFNSLVLDDLISINLKILKNCSLIEKNLPENDIVTKLRESAESFKEKLPVIGYLRNPTLKIRHWVKIEQILNKKLIQDETITLAIYEASNAFGIEQAEELMMIAGQSSAEAGLEILFKKVENAWKEYELSIVPHKEGKDVFILAGIDELQILLDESNININTIAASRHVGPIKQRVDEWCKMLDTFGQILDEWMSCQQSWIYLEAIFSAPDIQRQLPNEARIFSIVDKSWKETMRQSSKMPLALPILSEEGLLDKMKHNNTLLEKLTRCLEAYLEVKRVAFPRFYFLSNDELLEILAQTKNPHAVQPHLRKCFDAIARLEFGSKENPVGGKPIVTNDIMAMISPEGERIEFGLGLKARGAIEDWLSKVEQAMFVGLKRNMKLGYVTYPLKDRSEWFQQHPNQIVLTVSQQQWCTDVHSILDAKDGTNVTSKLKAFETKLQKDLSKLAEIARSNISQLLRKVLCALITIDVHAKDTITNLIRQNVTKSDDFNWLKMLRYYWIEDTETMQANMSSASLPYLYEYLGASGVLVITSLTDRCYLCLMGALQMNLGGAPAGPAGTGKTETTKDLAKALAKQCVVFNCSEGLDYKMMGTFFSGLAQSGAWCCFDEFNRIDIEVLSVIAQQLITIRAAKSLRQKRFMFEGREIKLEMSCAAFITMNPGYAGRTELPDNLKALFRPISMMVPDYALIAEVILYSEGFEGSRILAQKMVQMYKLCSEQLSQQDHYDFGMRAVKSVLVMAGTLKRSAPNQKENITLISALRDSNLPKFLAKDAQLFRGILSDLFPGVELPKADYGELQLTIQHCMRVKKLLVIPELVLKTIQLYETMCVRWGVMLVGPTGGGKTSVLHTLADALTMLSDDQVEDPNFKHVRIQTLNPKAVSLDELYGAVNPNTMEWKDGLLGIAVRSAVGVENENHQWVVCDGPVDAVWIENMNTVLDDNKMLCLANSERIKLSPWVHMIFEVQDLAQASPATVSRCGMVYVDPDQLGWVPLVYSWIETIKFLSENLKKFTTDLFHTFIKNILNFARRNCVFPIHQVESSKISMLCTLVETLLKEKSKRLADEEEEDKSKNLILKVFIWSLLWSIGGNVNVASREKLELHLRQLLKKYPESNLPETSIWDLKINLETENWETWNTTVPKFNFNSDMPYFDMIVPTSDTERFGYIAELLFQEGKHVMFTGDTGVGKSILAKTVLAKLSLGKTIPVVLNFSAQTSSRGTQEMIESRLEKRKKTQLGAPMGKVLVVFIDDVNMPKNDAYGSQPPIELLRQFLDFKGFYDREKLYWKEIMDVVLGAACAPPGGGRNQLTARFVRHFALLMLPPPNIQTLSTIFNSIMTGFLDQFNASVRPLAEPIVSASIDIYTRISQELLPTPDKSHYVFNLRDLSKCIQGVLQADSSNYNMPQQLMRLLYHESMRVFHDRLVNREDKEYFKNLLRETCFKYFNNNIVKEDETLLFGDFMVPGQNKEDRIYEEIKDLNKLKSILMDYLEDFNSLTGQEMKLILFDDAIEHILRLARLLRAERGNGLLVGLSGMGKQSLTKLASHLNGYKCIQIELCRGYDHESFHEDLRKLYWTSGVLNTPTVFLITDTQIIKEEFSEDLSNILNSGEVPNLFEGDEYEKIILGVRQDCLNAKTKDCSRDGIFNYFINRVRSNLHIVISMSPIGDAFRRRCRMFPSLLNCCTIDWFVKWPPEALYTVAVGLLAENEEYCESLAKVCVLMHETVEVASERFYKELRRHYYTTPSSYLELLKLYQSLLKQRADIIVARRKRIKNGLNKILETNQLVVVMQAELQDIFPILEESSSKMKELIVKLDKDTEVADVVRKNVTKDEAEAKVKAAETQEIADDATKDLEIAMPALRSAQEALKGLNKNDINELKSFQVPPKLVQFVMEPVCLLLGAKTDWAAAKIVLSDVNFLKKLVEFDKEHISDKTLLKLKTYINHKDFEPAKVEKVSKVCKSMCLWVRAMDEYAKIYKIVEPKIKRHKDAATELKQVMGFLRQKQNELAEIEGKIQALKDIIDEKNRQFKIIQDNVDLTTGRLNRASRLTSALSDEEHRWGETVETLTSELWAIPGDVLVASACIAYLGAFSINYRMELGAVWINACKALNIPSSSEFMLVKVLGDPYEIRNWNMDGLPKDEVSIENGIIVKQALRWPLIIDPQEQANRWIRNMEKDNNLKIIKMTNPNLMRILEVCIRQGFPLLIEEVEETLDPTISPVLGRMFYMQDGRLLMKFGDSEIDYDPNFKLYMTTKLSNPHYLPEVCIQVTLVNFLVTMTGLEDQLLAEVVAIELPELEKQRSDLIVKINSDRQQLLLLEDKVLRLLFSSQGNILDDEELVETLNEAKETSAIIAARLIDTERTEAIITKTREKYRPLAARGALLFFVIGNLSEIDPMYQNSLKYFTQVFCSVIRVNQEKMEIEERIKTLMNLETYALYENISRGLFEKHKLVYSFLLAVAVSQSIGLIKDDELQFLIRGPVGTKAEIIEKPNELSSMSDYHWKCCLHLENEYPTFEGLCADLTNQIVIKLDDFHEEISYVKNPINSLKNWSENLSSFQKLLLITSTKQEKLVNAISSYVSHTLGKVFTETAKNITLASLFMDTSSTTPLVFILSSGSDPMAALLRFADEKEFSDKLHSISLGQGQGPAAESLIEKGRTQGHWIFLQNCHLATSWMEKMEVIVRNMALGVTQTHPDFRLFLSSMPTTSFPVSVLQNSLKLTNEPPKGLRSNLMRALGDITKDFFELHIQGDNWKSMVFGLCLFHGVILERRKFGPLGWNITYEFSESDRECGLDVLDMFCDRQSKRTEIPWDALEYINGEVTWGGRVTDYWDQRCLTTILKIFSSPRILEPNYSYSESGVYYCPKGKNLEEFKEFIGTLPFYDVPEIFGMHKNANIVFEAKETQFFIQTLLECQSRGGSGSSESSDSNANCLEIIKQIGGSLTEKIDIDDVFPSLIELDDQGRIPSLSTVLFQEVERYNKILVIIHSGLNNLQKAIKGTVVMSEALEEIFTAFSCNQVPKLWASKGFLSTKSLSYWVFDFQYRIDFIQTWVRSGLPRSSWISGLYFPQSFLTGALQMHARKHNLPIDSLKIDFEILNPTIFQKDVYEEHLRNAEESSDLYSGLDYPDTGVYIHGIFIEAGQWSSKEGLCDANIGVLSSSLPVVWIKPCLELKVGNRYEAPLYKTQVRAGVLSTTGHSTNFILGILLNTLKPSEFWILRGTALVTMISE